MALYKPLSYLFSIKNAIPSADEDEKRPFRLRPAIVMMYGAIFRNGGCCTIRLVLTVCVTVSEVSLG